MKKIKTVLSWFFIGILIAFGVCIYGFPGHSFLAYTAFGIAALLLCYKLLRLIAKHHPKTARALRICLNICLCLGFLAAALTFGFIASASSGEADTSCEYVIVLGAGVNGTSPSLILSERIQRAYEYLSENPDVICIVSGGQGPNEDITEAQCMFDHLTAKGIDPDRIWQEDKSTSTRENIRFSLDVIEEKTGVRPTSAAIVSNEFHLFRAGLFAQEQDLEICGVPAKTGWLSLRVNYFLREIVAVWYYILLGG